MAVGVGVRVGVSVGVGDDVAVAVDVGVAVGVPGPVVGVLVPTGVAVGVPSAYGDGVPAGRSVSVGTLATAVGEPPVSVGNCVTSGDRIARTGVAVGVGGLGVLVGVGVAAGLLKHGPQARVNQTRINDSKSVNTILYQPCRTARQEVKTHPPARIWCAHKDD